LADAAYGSPDIGSATPFSNDAQVFSYPREAGSNVVPDGTATLDVDRLARRSTGRIRRPRGQWLVWDAQAHLLARNLSVVFRLHPGYDKLVAQFVRRILWHRPAFGWTPHVGDGGGHAKAQSCC
jgi:hypothetical protein